jgi:hypothetical protein
MINNQKISSGFGTPLRKRLVIGATSVLAAGALLGAGAAGASAATVQPTPVPTHSSTAAHSHNPAVSLIEQLRADLFQGSISGSKAQALAGRIIDSRTVFAALPANLQSDLTALKNAPAADTAAQAQQVKSTALSGGYGQQVKTLAADLQTSAKYPISKKLVSEIRRDLASGTTAGATGASIAKTVTEHPQLLSKLPASLQSDVTALKNAPAAADSLQVLKIESAAVAGTYGQQIQTLAQQLVSASGTATK